MSLEQLKAERDAWREAFIAIREKMNAVSFAAAGAAGTLRGLADSEGTTISEETAALCLAAANDLWCPDKAWSVLVPTILKSDPEFYSPAECN